MRRFLPILFIFVLQLPFITAQPAPQQPSPNQDQAPDQQGQPIPDQGPDQPPPPPQRIPNRPPQQPTSVFTIPPCKTPRQRVEFRELTERQRQSYLEAVRCIRNTPSILDAPGSRSVYDDFVYVHRESVPQAHNVAAFLPWHRALVALYETSLRTICNYTAPFPYWDWSYDSQAPERSPLLSPRYFGTNGAPPDYCLTTGFFANATAAYPDIHCIQRQFLTGVNGSETLGDMFGAQYSPVEMEWISGQETYDGFRRMLESHPHNQVHISLGGDMAGLITSVNDPIFFLHHTNIDRWWWRWQAEHPNIANTYSGNTNPANIDVDDATPDDVMIYSGMHRNIQVGEVFNTEGGWNGLLCYTYSNSIRPPNITDPRLLQPVTTTQSATQRRRRRRQLAQMASPGPYDRTNTAHLRTHTPFPDSFYTKMNVSSAQIDWVKNTEKVFEGLVGYVNGAGYRSPVALGKWVGEGVGWDLDGDGVVDSPSVGSRWERWKSGCKGILKGFGGVRGQSFI